MIKLKKRASSHVWVIEDNVTGRYAPSCVYRETFDSRYDARIGIVAMKEKHPSVYNTRNWRPVKYVSEEK